MNEPTVAERVVARALEILTAADWDGEDEDIAHEALAVAIDDVIAAPPYVEAP